MSGAPNAAAMAAPAPAPTKVRRSLRRRLNARPVSEASAAAHLGVGRLQPHRGAEAVGDHGLEGDEQAVAQRHPPAAQGVGLHRVDRRRRAGCGSRARCRAPAPRRPAAARPAASGSILVRALQPLVEVDVVEQLLQAVGGHADGDGGQARRRRRPARRSPPATARWRGSRRAGRPAPPAPAAASAGAATARSAPAVVGSIGGDRLVVDRRPPAALGGSLDHGDAGQSIPTNTGHGRA